LAKEGQGYFRGGWEFPKPPSLLPTTLVAAPPPLDSRGGRDLHVICYTLFYAIQYKPN
jgi:hypothetical protein